MPAAPAATRKSLSLLNVFIICLPLLSLLVETTSVSAQQAEADVLVAQAVLAYDEKRYDEALRLLERALELDPRDPRGLYYLGLVYLALEQPSRAIPPLKTLRTLRPTDIQAQYQLGVAYFTVGDYERAGPLLEEVFRQKPDLENLGYYVGIVRHQRKDYSEALKAFDAVKTSDPDIRQLSLFYKGLSLGVLGLPKQALAELESAQRVQAVSPVTGTAVRIQGRSQQVPDQERQSACGPKSLWEGFTMTTSRSIPTLAMIRWHRTSGADKRHRPVCWARCSSIIRFIGRVRLKPPQLIHCFNR